MKTKLLMVFGVLSLFLISNVLAQAVIFYDDFDDGEINTTLWVNSGCSEFGGNMDCGDNYPAGDNIFVRSVNLSTLGINLDNDYDLEFSLIRFKGRNGFALMSEEPILSGDTAETSVRGTLGLNRQILYAQGGSNDASRINGDWRTIPSPRLTQFGASTINFIHNSSGYFTLRNGEVVANTSIPATDRFNYIALGDWETSQAGYGGAIGYIQLTQAPPCEENWTASYSMCSVEDEEVLTYIDTNNCGVYDELPSDNGTISSCNYCTASYNENINGCLKTYTWNNYNSCCAVTNIPADCSIPTNMTTCVGMHTSSDIGAVIIDFFVEYGLGMISLVGLIAVVGLGVLAYKKLR